MNFYTKVLSRFAATPGLKLTIAVEVSPPDGLPQQSLEETQNALRELGLDDRVTEKSSPGNNAGRWTNHG
jgi:hypothetical protein